MVSPPEAREDHSSTTNARESGSQPGKSGGQPGTGSQPGKSGSQPGSACAKQTQKCMMQLILHSSLSIDYYATTIGGGI